MNACRPLAIPLRVYSSLPGAVQTRRTPSGYCKHGLTKQQTYFPYAVFSVQTTAPHLGPPCSNTVSTRQAVCNLVSCPDSQLASVEAGAVPCLRQLAKLGVPEIEVRLYIQTKRESPPPPTPHSPLPCFTYIRILSIEEDAKDVPVVRRFRDRLCVLYEVATELHHREQCSRYTQQI